MLGLVCWVLTAVMPVWGADIPPDRREMVVSGVTKTNLALRWLELESRVVPGTEAMRRVLGGVLDDAVSEVRRVDPWAGGTDRQASRPGRWTRVEILRVLGVVDDVLVRNGFVHPAGGVVGLLSEAFTPFEMGERDRALTEGRPENARRREMIAARFPGPFYPIDCDTAACLYLGVAERLGWPLRMVLVPSRNRQRGHVFVRWREGGRRVDWETTEGRERGVEVGREARERGEGLVWSGPEVEVGMSEVEACAHYVVAVHLERLGEGRAALREFSRALAVFPGHLDARRQWAWNMATLPDLAERDVEAAVEHAREVVRRCGDADTRDTLAAAYAASGRFDRAVREEKAAIADGEASEMARAGYRHRLGLYLRGEVYRQPGR